MQTISELVKAQKAASDLSYEALAQRAQKVGLGLTKQQLSDLANNRPKGWPKSAEMVQALSVALNVSERTVVLSYAASFGIDVSETRSPFEVRLPATVSSLDPSMQDAILHVIRAATEGAEVDERTEEEVTEPGTQESYPSAMSRAGVSPAHVDASAEGEVPAVPRPKDEYALAASDEPSEGRALREQQDADAENNQTPDDWESA